MPTVVEGLVAHFEIPAIVDLLFRLVQCEDTVPDSGIVAWLAENDLIPRIVSLLSPHVSTEKHKAASEFLKTIISLSAPSPSSLNQVTMQESFTGPGEMLLGAGGVNNLLVREMASEENVAKMLSFMLDYSPSNATQGDESRGLDMSLQTLQEDSAVEEEDEDEDVWAFQKTMKDRQNRHYSISRRLSTAGKGVRDSTATVRPSTVGRRNSMKLPVTQEAISSSFSNCAGVFIELIRKNNSDYFEQHLFHTLRNYLVVRQQELSGQHRQQKLLQRMNEGNAADKPELSLEDLPFDDDADAEGLDEAMDEVAEKMGIVHLGPLLRALADKIPELQEKMRNLPQPAMTVTTTLGQIEPLTQTRYCIAELYAELLHCSNMALLNRPPNVGPRYSPSGSLMGGLEGLQALARTLQGDEECVQPESAPSRNTAMSQEDEENAETNSDDQKPSTSASYPASNDSNESDDTTSEEDAASIASALSSMSLADLVTQLNAKRPVAEESNYEILGNYLKKQFLTFKVIPTLIELFLHYPWNNFLHNVVYDILQQLFNGDMESAINRKLTISAFDEACLVEAILEGARRNQESSQGPRRIRLGYMGHLNLIAEEVIKLMERHSDVFGEKIHEHFTPEWEEYLNDDLNESRAKESMPLAGGRPSNNMSGMQCWSNLESDDWYSENDNNRTFAQYLSAQMRTDNDDLEADGDMLSNMTDTNMLGRIPSDNDWGPFSDSAQFAFEFTSTASVSVNEPAQENLTPADWAAEFRRGGGITEMSNASVDNDSDSDDMGVLGRDDISAETDSDENLGDNSPFVDLHKPAALRQRTLALDCVQPERILEPSNDDSDHWPAAPAARHVRYLSSGGEDKAAELAATQLPEDVEPTEDGLLRRTLADGTSVTVPLDDAELSASQNIAKDHS
ncbi:hypothetical protein MNAN1_001153 [Malassezia nana]|uniref:Extragenic suppressor of kinetochore protein 1 n=1 Tax=Malassezia nana TaxID=180528 RepID=A0AAF0ENV1_9BASI|nr:hypothetical protein MNAN1_001153 [Malassezia nana]